MFQLVTQGRFKDSVFIFAFMCPNVFCHQSDIFVDMDLYVFIHLVGMHPNVFNHLWDYVQGLIFMYFLVWMTDLLNMCLIYMTMFYSLVHIWWVDHVVNSLSNKCHHWWTSWLFICFLWTRYLQCDNLVIQDQYFDSVNFREFKVKKKNPGIHLAVYEFLIGISRGHCPQLPKHFDNLAFKTFSL